MELTTHEGNHENAFILAIATLFDRAGYYGVRVLIVRYMTSEIIGITNYSAYETYGLLLYFLLVTQLLGGLLGDFRLGHKKAIIIGGLLQALGCFIMCIPDKYPLYLGLVLIAMGSGLCRPNLLACYGKTYDNKPQYFDSVFSFFFMVINLGAFFGVLLSQYLVETHGYMHAFSTAALLYIIAAALLLALKQDKQTLVYNKQHIFPKSVFYVTTVIFLSGIFWFAYEMGMIYQLDLLKNTVLKEQVSLYFSQETFENINFYLVTASFFIIGLVWLVYHRYQFIKITVGFAFVALGLFILSQIHTVTFDEQVSLITWVILLFVLAEIFIGPIILTVIAKYTNPKYLATVMGLFAMITGLFIIGSNRFHELFYGESLFLNNTGFIIAGVTLALLLIGLLINNNYVKHTNDEKNNRRRRNQL